MSKFEFKKSKIHSPDCSTLFIGYFKIKAKCVCVGGCIHNHILPTVCTGTIQIPQAGEGICQNGGHVFEKLPINQSTAFEVFSSYISENFRIY